MVKAEGIFNVVALPEYKNYLTTAKIEPAIAAPSPCRWAMVELFTLDKRLEQGCIPWQQGRTAEVRVADVR